MQCARCGTWFTEDQLFCSNCGIILTDQQNQARIGHLRLIARLGEGGMGIVYRAHDERRNSDVAIKILPQQKLDDARQVQRFRREARVQGELNHPNLVKLIELYERDNVLAIVMELLQGCTLKEYVRHVDRLSWGEVHHVADAVLDGLGAAHAHDIVHRDLKLSNIFLDDDGAIKIMDFGLAKSRNPAEDITQIGSAVGSYYYMAPEQITGGEIGPRTDLYALGVLLYRIATGHHPFVSTGGGQFEVMEKHVRQRPVPPRQLEPELPPVLEVTILALLEKEPAHRPADCREVKLLLAGMEEPRPLARPIVNGKRVPFSWLHAGSGRQVDTLSESSAEFSADLSSVREVEEHPGTLLWALRHQAPPAPDTPPLDLSSPPALDRGHLDHLRRAIDDFAPLPADWARVLKQLQNPEFSPAEQAEIIGDDSALALALIMASNRAAGPDATPARNLALALTSLGPELTHDLVLKSYVERCFPEAEGEQGRAVWFHSLAVAQIARILSEFGSVVDRHSAGTFGVLHDIGKFVLLHVESGETLSRLHDRIGESGVSLRAEWDLLGYTHIDAGMMLAMRWRLPRAVHRFLYFHHHPAWHSPEKWPLDMQAPVMLQHVAHIILQSILGGEANSGVWNGAMRSHQTETEGMLRQPLRLPLDDQGLWENIQDTVRRVRRICYED